jgi:hypothetical protein
MKRWGRDIVARFVEYQLELLEIYRANPNREVLKDKMIASLSDNYSRTCSRAVRNVSLESSKCLVILSRSVAALKAWLNLLNAGDGCRYVG